MSLLSKLKSRGTYKVWVKCPNCGFGSEVKIPKGVSVGDFVKGGKCKCDSCFVTFFPTEYTTTHFEKEKREKEIRNHAPDLPPKPKPNQDYKKDHKKLNDYKEEIKNKGETQWW